MLKFQKWFTNAEILRMATGNNGEIVRMSGQRNPYPKQLGVVAEVCNFPVTSESTLPSQCLPLPLRQPLQLGTIEIPFRWGGDAVMLKRWVQMGRGRGHAEALP